MAVTVGTAPDSWGVWFGNDPKQTPWNRFLDEVVEAGYEWIELGPYGYLPTELKTLRDELDKRKLKVSGTFVMHHLEDEADWPNLDKDVADTGKLLAELGAKFMVLIDDTYTDLFTGELTRPARLDGDAWNKLVEATNRVGRTAWDQFGLRLVYHPHAETHVEYEDQIERLLEQTDPAYVNLCFDTGHHAYRKGDPVQFILKHPERVPYLHLKSLDAGLREKVAAENIPFALAVGMDLFCEPSRGAVDFIALRDALRQVGFDGWAMVEQDMYPAPFDKPLPIAKRTRAYLREIGIG